MTIERFSLEGTVVLITGASSGIGRTLAPAMAQAGAAIVATARRMDRLEQLVAEIRAAGGTATAVTMDVTDTDSVKAAYDHAESEIGMVNAVINNAGMGSGRPFQDANKEQYDLTMATNVDGVWNVAQEAVQRLIAAKQPGSIVNVASILGLGGKNHNAAYCTSKGAVVQLTRAMAMDLAKFGIRVNTLAPGWYVTEITEEYLTSEAGLAYMKRTPARRAGELEELIGPVMMLLSPSASFVNGIVLPVDGGHSAAVI